ncbi:MAG: ChaN family lipoprotein [Planctomycetes bacterium]|nr:ChaN family lipoprotein [Planctomycetota bacterium]
MHEEFRSKLISTQEKLMQAVSDGLDAYRLDASPAARKYYDEYAREFEGITGSDELAGRIVSVDALVEGLSRRDAIFIGDFHTLRQSQLEQLQILRALHRTGRRIVVGTEIFRSVHQDSVSMYLAGRIRRASTLLEKTAYSETWGFDWNNYRLVIDFCRAAKIPVVCLNSLPPQTNGSLGLGERDHRAASIIAKTLVKEPDALFVCIFGDLHVATPHLPDLVRKEVGDLRDLDFATLFQNYENLYFKLCHENLLDNGRALDLGDSRYVIFNTNPVAKLQSYYLWESNSHILRAKLHRSFAGVTEDAEELENAFVMLYGALGELLSLDAPEFDAEIHFGADLKFLRGAGQKKHARDLIERVKGYFFEDREIIHLADLSLDVISELVSRYLLYQCRRSRLEGRALAPAKNQVDRFYNLVIEHAVAWIGSKLINPQRVPYDVPRLREVLSSYHSQMERSDAFTFLADGAYWFFEHRKLIFDFISASGDEESREDFYDELTESALFVAPEVIFYSAARLVGYSLGESISRTLFYATDYGATMNVVADIKWLINTNLSRKNEARETYFNLTLKYRDLLNE